jgi:hypothetical protein
LPCFRRRSSVAASKQIDRQHDIALGSDTISHRPDLVIQAPPFVNYDDARQRVNHICREYEVAIDQFLIDFRVRQCLGDNRPLWCSL